MLDRLSISAIQCIGQELAIVWGDATESYFPLEALRRSCPCALCGGEPDVLGHLERPELTYTPESFELRGWQVVGGYAIQPTWADGHGTGLYSFKYLRALAAHLAAPSA